MEGQKTPLEKQLGELSKGQLAILDRLYDKGPNGMGGGMAVFALCDQVGCTPDELTDLIHRGLWVIKDGKVVHPDYA